MIETAPITEKAVIVGLINHKQDERQAKEYLDELEFLADTAGAVVLKKFTQKLEKAYLELVESKQAKQGGNK